MYLSHRPAPSCCSRCSASVMSVVQPSSPQTCHSMNGPAVFGSERLTGALLDRLTHHVHILEMNGDSYRLAHSKRQKRSGPSDGMPQDQTKNTPRPPIGGLLALVVDASLLRTADAKSLWR